MGASQVAIPRAFSWLLPAQGFVAAIIIYASIYVFTVGSLPFILACVAAGLHFILGLYLCFAGNKPGAHHLYIIPVWLIACAGVWAGTLYYFASALDVVIKFPGVEPLPEQPLWTTWVKVGTATAALNVVLDFALLAFFIHGAVRSTSRSTPTISAPIYNQPQVTAHPPAQQQQFSTPPPQQYQQYPQYSHQQHQYQQFQQPQQPTQYQYQQQHHQPQQQYQPPQQGYISPLAQSPSNDYKTSTPPTSTASPVGVGVGVAVTSPGYDHHNRIDVIRRLCSLQHPDGHWDYSTELAELVKMWGGRDLMAPAHGATALTHACLSDLCNYVWTAQRDGREHESLSAAELISLQGVNWDLGWAKNAMDRAAAWMGGYR
ncbi:hypothetical protein B0T16DRAFT_459664 [Cercophora newfieldiana]|uniref:Uncharacterized protein n=1 Tax=Cercophora newfieldiana TaxID=92897 RepID=A0AA39Y281_9PEZI|nr:hypothetical protein B0T16DRAFT_459664 [Cercophora newfieldiana]